MSPGKTEVKQGKFVKFICPAKGYFRGIDLSKALTCMKIFLYIKTKIAFFIKETDNFGHIIV